MPPEYDRLTVEGDDRWEFVPRGDLVDEPDPEEQPAQELFSKDGEPQE